VFDSHLLLILYIMLHNKMYNFKIYTSVMLMSLNLLLSNPLNGTKSKLHPQVKQDLLCDKIGIFSAIVYMNHWYIISHSLYEPLVHYQP